MLRIPSRTIQQPRAGNIGPAGRYGDLYAAFVGCTRDIIGSGSNGVRAWSGSPAQQGTRDGIATAASSYTVWQYWIGDTIDGATLDWGGITVVVVIPEMVDLSPAQYPGAVTIMPYGEFYGVGALTIPHVDSPDRRDIGWRAGDSTASLTPTNYGAGVTSSSDQWAAGDRLVIVGRWDKSTTSLAVLRNDTITRNSSAHAFGWRTGSHLVNVGGYYRTGHRSLTSPIALAAILPRDVGEGAEAELLENPWALFESRRIFVPAMASGAPAFNPAWAANANTMIQGAAA